MTIRNLLSVLLLLIAPTLTAAETMTPAMKTAIQDLMEVTGATQMKTRFSEAYVQQMQALFATGNPRLSLRALEMVAQETRVVLDARLDGEHGLFASIYPIYQQHFTLTEIEALVAFYRTPAGKKAISVMPQVTLQSMQASQHWAQSVGHAVQIRVKQRLAAEGLR